MLFRVYPRRHGEMRCEHICTDPNASVCAPLGLQVSYRKRYTESGMVARYRDMQDRMDADEAQTLEYIKRNSQSTAVNSYLVLVCPD